MHASFAIAGQYSKSGELFISAGQDESVTLYDSTSWQPRKEVAARGVRWTITSTDLSPDERFMTYTTIASVRQLYPHRNWHASVFTTLDSAPNATDGFAIACVQ